MTDEGTGLPANHPTRVKFTMLAVDTHRITHQLQALAAHYNAHRRRYADEMKTMDGLRGELAHERSRLTDNDYDEGELNQSTMLRVRSDKLNYTHLKAYSEFTASASWPSACF